MYIYIYMYVYIILYYIILFYIIIYYTILYYIVLLFVMLYYVMYTYWNYQSDSILMNLVRLSLHVEPMQYVDIRLTSLTSKDPSWSGGKKKRRIHLFATELTEIWVKSYRFNMIQPDTSRYESFKKRNVCFPKLPLRFHQPSPGWAKRWKSIAIQRGVARMGTDTAGTGALKPYINPENFES